jgi:hypothetical protein
VPLFFTLMSLSLIGIAAMCAQQRSAKTGDPRPDVLARLERTYRDRVSPVTGKNTSPPGRSSVAC